MRQRSQPTTMLGIWAAFSLFLIVGAVSLMPIAGAQPNTSTSGNGAEGNKVAPVVDASEPMKEGGVGENDGKTLDEPDEVNTTSESTWDKVKWLVIGVGAAAIVMMIAGVVLALRRNK